VRLDSRRVLTSPTGMSKGMMSPDDLVITDLKGRKLAGRREASSELAMHNLIYNRRPDVHAVATRIRRRHRARRRGNRRSTRRCSANL
jgi:L-fuculose-phosphate aldolase